MQRPPGIAAQEVLVLLQPAGRVHPQGTAAWLARRPVADHAHLRRGHAADVERLARLQARLAVGLVLAGGGARGLAHLGVWQALQERGVDVDVVGGTSIGGLMAALMAADRPFDEALRTARRTFLRNPTGDLSLLPLVSLVCGRRLERAIDTALRELDIGGSAEIADLCKGFFCIATNFSRSRPELLGPGPLARLLRAGAAIPGVLPPVVHAGDLLADGQLQQLSGRRDARHARRGARDRCRPAQHPRAHAGLRRGARVVGTVAGPAAPTLAAALPSLLFNANILYSRSRQGEVGRRAHLLIEPQIERIGMLQWSRFDDIVRLGHDQAVKVLAAGGPR